MITISEKAKKYFVKLLLNQKKNTHLRIFIMYPGTVHAECGIAYCDIKEINDKEDEIFDYKNFFCVIKKEETPFFRDAKIDISHCNNNLDIKLILNAPYAKNKQTNFIKNSLEKKIEDYLNCFINPELMMHKGKIELIKITKEKYALVKFSGGCNGCSMINTTLKQGVEKKIIKQYPQIKGLIDVTQHERGDHSYS
ncbi:Fe-S biogenesis protein NfuA [Buchnera aphidicola (Thelaxes californica)]|uniref:Fe/S biogenesis protein NfuA n=1 Tax=Buchnera aphidicola (Thelaxes californica) TaxID=1315998 RepID=A0A4D6YFP2_9GAMM|nr:NifU family protein [Buchnera aphidicola]QCI26943.1 Fe-S biogenesis protein NfuA [Buchnera aphidicola (Thelaxes californica)]